MKLYREPVHTVMRACIYFNLLDVKKFPELHCDKNMTNPKTGHFPYFDAGK